MANNEYELNEELNEDQELDVEDDEELDDEDEESEGTGVNLANAAVIAAAALGGVVAAKWIGKQAWRGINWIGGKVKDKVDAHRAKKAEKAEAKEQPDPAPAPQEEKHEEKPVEEKTDKKDEKKKK